MTRSAAFFAALASIATLVLAVPISAAAGKVAYGFNAGDIRGFATGAVSLSGGGAFDLATGFVETAGGFRCRETVAQGPLSGCRAGEGIRWDTAALLPGTTFKCTGAASEAPKTATTGTDTVVVRSDFYRAGDGVDESFTAQMIVSENDIAADIPGVQNVWVQGVGCGSAVGSFNSARAA